MDHIYGLTFAGELAWWQGLALALLGAFLAWSLYRRELRAGPRRWTRVVLPLLRCLAVFAVCICLTGPVITRRFVEGQLGRVAVFVDGSRSMSVQDDALDTGRKLLIAAAKRLVPEGALDAKLLELVHALGKAVRLARSPASGDAQARRNDALIAEVRRAAELLAEINPTRLPAPEPSRGQIRVEYFDAIPGSKVQDLQADARFTKEPTKTELRDSLASARNRGDNHGTRIRGFLRPPQAGAYAFCICGDDQSILKLSDDEDPANAREIARVENYAPQGTWDADPAQRSAPIALEAERDYYFEVLHKQGSGDSHVLVGWDWPDGTRERPIRGAHLRPFQAEAMASAQIAAVWRKTFQDQVAAPAGALSKSPGEKAEALRARLLPALAAWERRTADAFAVYAAAVIASGDTALVRELQEFDAMPRWKRGEALLLDPAEGLVAKLRDTHRVELNVLSGARCVAAWQSDEPGDPPRSLPGEPDGAVTDLSSGVRALMEHATERTAAVLISDGRHNDGPAPRETAKLLGARGVPVYTIGLGMHREPADLAVMRLDAPESVFADDRIAGKAQLLDRMPAGTPFTLVIRHEGREVWRRELTAAGAGARTIDFDFPIKDLTAGKLTDRQGDVEVFSLPLRLDVAIEPLPGEARQDNNTAALRFRAVTHGRRVLLIDGRPRWETRFVRNLFERDTQWRVDTLLAAPGERAWAKGEGLAAFPRDRESLYAYGVVILGEVPPGIFKDEELAWLRDFVERRGGGLVFVDGRRGFFREYRETSLADLFPVEWRDDLEAAVPERLALAAAGVESPAFRLEDDPERNAEVWGMFPAPHWAAPCRALPGALTYVDAVIPGGENLPVMVERRFGAGMTFHLGIDSLWRWRYEVADRYHTKFWNQLAAHLMEAPFAVRDKYVALDAGGPAYAASDAAPIRVRLDDREGKPLLDASAQALLFRNGTHCATITLAPDPNRGGVYRGATAPLEPGEYEVGVQVAGFSDLEMKARTTFTVEERVAKEFLDLTCDEELLGDLAEVSGGVYLREEDASALPALLAPLSEGKVLVAETRLANSYLLFVPIVALLALEWLLRKRTGML